MIALKYNLNLQFFSAESEGRTEKATPKKKEDTRKKGQVAKSAELNTAVLIVGFCAVSLMLGGYMLSSIQRSLISSMNRLSGVFNEVTSNYMSVVLRSALIDILLICLPLWGSLFVIAFIISYIQVGYKVSFEPMKVKMSKMNPINGIKRIISKDMVISLILSTAKVIVLGSIVYNIIMSKIPIFLRFYELTVEQILNTIAMTVVQLGFFVGGAFLVLAVLDYVYQRFKHADSIKMSKQEVKEEYKNAEGDPQIKSKMKQKMREGSMKRMMQAIPEADVIITNPTHFAIAIKYDETKGIAPIVVAKGVDYVAQKIKEKAKEHGIEIVENKPLARALYYTVDLNKEIPPELYSAVAEVLAFIYNLQSKKTNRRS